MRLQYKDYAVWQRSFQEKEGYQKQEAYWLKRLEGELPVLELPADKPRPAVRSFAGGSVSCTLDAETASGFTASPGITAPLCIWCFSLRTIRYSRA